MKKQLVFKMSKRPAFTLVEVLLTLIVSTVLLGLLHWGQMIVKKQTSHNDTAALAWQVTLLQLEAPGHHFQVTGATSHELSLIDPRGRATTVQLKNHILQLLVDERGYQPLVYQVADFNCQFVKQRAQISIRLLSGRQFTNIIDLPVRLNQKK